MWALNRNGDAALTITNYFFENCAIMKYMYMTGFHVVLVSTGSKPAYFRFTNYYIYLELYLQPLPKGVNFRDVMHKPE